MSSLPFTLPDLGEGLQEATIRSFYVEPGDEVTLNQPLLAVETAKALVDIPAPFAGKILETHACVGETLATGATLMTIECDMEDEALAPTLHPPQPGRPSDTSAISLPERNLTPQPTSCCPDTTPRAMPATRELARRHGIDLHRVKGTGSHGLITREDVERVRVGNTAEDDRLATLNSHERQMYRIIQDAHRDVAHTTVFQDADVGHWSENTPVTWKLVQALRSVLPQHPMLNSLFTDQGWHASEAINLALAVDMGNGLFMPVLKAVDNMTQKQFQTSLDIFKQKAEQRVFTPDDLQDGTFLLSNIGTVGGRYATPMVIPPMVASLAVGRTYPGIREFDSDGNITPTKFLPLSLSFNHNLLTGSRATTFLGDLAVILAST